MFHSYMLNYQGVDHFAIETHGDDLGSPHGDALPELGDFIKIWVHQCRLSSHGQWIGLRENLQETMVFTIKYRGFL